MGISTFIRFFFLTFIITPSMSIILKYHDGPLLKGDVTLNVLWYGNFTPIQRAVIVDFITSLTSPHVSSPSSASWWDTTTHYNGIPAKIKLQTQILHPKYSLGKSLTDYHLRALATHVPRVVNSVKIVLTADDVTVNGFCMSRCGTHGSTQGVAYVWVGNPGLQCPGYCAWPFHQPLYGPQDPPLVAPNGDVGVDGLIINLATVLAGAITNPFNEGFYQGEGKVPVYEAVSACTGIFGKGAYPGYAGEVLVDSLTGGSYNANGVNGRKFLLPAMWDPKTLACSTPV